MKIEYRKWFEKTIQDLEKSKKDKEKKRSVDYYGYTADRDIKKRRRWNVRVGGFRR